MCSNYLISILPVVVPSCGSRSFKALLLAGSMVSEALIIILLDYKISAQDSSDSSETRIFISTIQQIIYNCIIRSYNILRSELPELSTLSPLMFNFLAKW